jgi:hypothetical protein
VSSVPLCALARRVVRPLRPAQHGAVAANG